MALKNLFATELSNIPSRLLNEEKNQAVFRMLKKNCVALITTTAGFHNMNPNTLTWDRYCTVVVCFEKDCNLRTHFLRFYSIKMKKLILEQRVHSEGLWYKIIEGHKTPFLQIDLPDRTIGLQFNNESVAWSEFHELLSALDGHVRRLTKTAAARAAKEHEMHDRFKAIEKKYEKDEQKAAEDKRKAVKEALKAAEKAREKEEKRAKEELKAAQLAAQKAWEKEVKRAKEEEKAADEARIGAQVAAAMSREREQKKLREEQKAAKEAQAAAEKSREKEEKRVKEEQKAAQKAAEKAMQDKEKRAKEEQRAAIEAQKAAEKAALKASEKEEKIAKDAEKAKEKKNDSSSDGSLVHKKIKPSDIGPPTDLRHLEHIRVNQSGNVLHLDLSRAKMIEILKVMGVEHSNLVRLKEENHLSYELMLKIIDLFGGMESFMDVFYQVKLTEVADSMAVLTKRPHNKDNKRPLSEDFDDYNGTPRADFPQGKLYPDSVSNSKPLPPPHLKIHSKSQLSSASSTALESEAAVKPDAANTSKSAMSRINAENLKKDSATSEKFTKKPASPVNVQPVLTNPSFKIVRPISQPSSLTSTALKSGPQAFPVPTSTPNAPPLQLSRTLIESRSSSLTSTVSKPGPPPSSPPPPPPPPSSPPPPPPPPPPLIALQGNFDQSKLRPVPPLPPRYDVLEEIREFTRVKSSAEKSVEPDLLTIQKQALIKDLLKVAAALNEEDVSDDGSFDVYAINKEEKESARKK